MILRKGVQSVHTSTATLIITVPRRSILSSVVLFNAVAPSYLLLLVDGLVDFVTILDDDVITTNLKRKTNYLSISG
jgi:hypothetical protein